MHVIDLFAEHRVVTNGLQTETADPDLRGVLQASDRTAVERSSGEQHCEAVVKGLALLVRRLVPDLGQALRRGLYAKAVAGMQHRGFPISPIFHRAAIGLLERLREECCSAGRRREADDRLAKALRQTERAVSLPVGGDWRSRYELRPYAASTGRNQPKHSEHAWDAARFLISPPEGRAILVIDFAAEEFGVAANLSGDPAMIADYYTGDAYQNFGRRVGIDDRQLLKSLLLPLMYGKPAIGLARDCEITLQQARQIEAIHRGAYRHFWSWVDDVKAFAINEGSLHTVYGWRRQLNIADGIPPKDRLRSFANFPIQAHATEVLWQACRILRRKGFDVCGVNQDAVMLECDEGDIGDVKRAAEAGLADAAADVLGRPLKVDTEIVRSGERLRKGQRDWDKLTAAVGSKEVAWR